ncbi:MAG: hypothetical protein J4N64_08590, partial [Chloroflexi bacterium]|nr:hypothetical protein [Chloroflexota bacterium]
MTTACRAFGVAVSSGAFATTSVGVGLGLGTEAAVGLTFGAWTNLAFLLSRINFRAVEMSPLHMASKTLKD